MNQSPKLNPFFQMEDLFTPKEIELIPITNYSEEGNVNDEWKKYINDNESINLFDDYELNIGKSTLKESRRRTIDPPPQQNMQIENQKIEKKSFVMKHNEMKPSYRLIEKDKKGLKKTESNPSVVKSKKEMIKPDLFNETSIKKGGILSSIGEFFFGNQQQYETVFPNYKQNINESDDDESCRDQFIRKESLVPFTNNVIFKDTTKSNVVEIQSHQKEKKLESKTSDTKKHIFILPSSSIEKKQSHEEDESEEEDEEELIYSITRLSIEGKKFIFGKLQTHLIDVVIVAFDQ